VGVTLKITPTESIEILASDPEALLLEATYLPGKSPPKHFHPEQDEHFEVLHCEVRVDLAGEVRSYSAGEEFDVPRGTIHTFWNPGDGSARVRWRTSPAGRTEQWFRAINRIQVEGRVGKDGMPSPLAFGVLLTEYRDIFRLAGPDRLLRPALALLGEIGRRRGYRA
jgi:quercetin dioxygenase-like cupin family protein